MSGPGLTSQTASTSVFCKYSKPNFIVGVRRDRRRSFLPDGCHDSINQIARSSPVLLPTRIDGKMTSHVLALFIILGILLDFSEGLPWRKDVAFAAPAVGRNRRRQTINTSLFSTQQPPRRLLKKEH
eukprot:scaffold7715_cov91-Skeletonema_dohrnii-CCMP3373.AAC.8